MKKQEIFDRMFDVINETDGFDIKDITVNNDENTLSVLLGDGSRFSLLLNAVQA